METIECKNTDDVPKNYTGIAVFSNGDKYWYKNGELHREDGPAREYANGIKAWWVDGKRHRIDGPAVEDKNFGNSWYIKGKLHRIDGPAYEPCSGGYYGEKEWWVDGEKYSFVLDIRNKIFLGKEKGKYGLEWLKFLTEKEIEEIPIVPGLEYEFKIDLETLESFSKWK